MGTKGDPPMASRRKKHIAEREIKRLEALRRARARRLADATADGRVPKEEIRRRREAVDLVGLRIEQARERLARLEAE